MAVETAAPEIEQHTDKGHKRPGIRPYVRSWWTVPCGETMQRINVFQFYRFGRTMEQLNLIDKEQALIDQWGELWSTGTALDDLLAQEQIPLAAIAPAVRELKSRITAITDRIYDDKFDRAEKIKPTPFRALENSFRKFETVFEAEVSGRVNVYSVSSKGAYDTSLLVEQGDLAIHENLRSFIPEAARYDLRQSGRCLAFEVPTAAGFHVLRAAEVVIKAYYKKLTGKEWEVDHDPKQRSWGNYINGLETAGAKVNIVSSLRQVKDLYRNPIVHPEVQLDTTEAFSLFGMVISLIAAMLKEIRD